MRKHAVEFLAYAQSLGVHEAQIAHRSKHPKLHGRFQDKVVNFAFPGSPSDHRSMANARSALRRYLNARAALLQ